MFGQARRIQYHLELGMAKKGTLDGFRAELEKSAAEGTIRRLTSSELSDWHGPINYISLFAIIKPGSLTHKVQVVANLAQKNEHNGLSVNWGPTLSPTC